MLLGELKFHCWRTISFHESVPALQPAQYELLRAGDFFFLENQTNALNCLWLIEQQPNPLNTRHSGPPTPLAALRECSFKRITGSLGSEFDDSRLLEVQPARTRIGVVLANWRDQPFSHVRFDVGFRELVSPVRPACMQYWALALQLRQAGSKMFLFGG